MATGRYSYTRRRCLYWCMVILVCLFLSTTFLLSLQLEEVLLSGGTSINTSTNSNTAVMDHLLKYATVYSTSTGAQSSMQHQHQRSNWDPSPSLPYFVVHIGPQKTMSSAIQCSLQKLQANLTLDGYNFVGKCDARACYHNSPSVPVESALIEPFYGRGCVEAIASAAAQPQNLSNVECWREFLHALSNKTVDNHNHTRANIILSDEKISEAQLKWWDVERTETLWEILQQQIGHIYNIQIVMVYRRYYEWLASVKNQGDKYSLGRRGIKMWNGPAKEAIYPHLMQWIKNTSLIPSPYLPELYDLYSNNMKLDVSLLNMHDGTDLLEEFLCRTLKGADHTCRAYRSNPDFYRSNSNPSENHFYDMIAYDGYHRGLVRDLRDWRKGADRLFHNEMIGRRMQRQHKTPWDLPLKCPSRDDLLPFLEISQQLERDFLPDFYSSRKGEGALAMKFWKDVHNRKFCSVDTKAVLDQPEWQLFFHNLWDPRRGEKPDDWETSDYKITSKNFSNNKG